MEIHVSSNDQNLITNLCMHIEDEIQDVKGYVSYQGYDINGNTEYKIYHNEDDITKQFPKLVTFGQMLDIMRHCFSGKGNKIYFQREDWRNSHKYIALNSNHPQQLYLEIFYNDKRMNVLSDDVKTNKYGIPYDKHPYIPSYEDMFYYNWIIYDIDNKMDKENEQEESIDIGIV